MGRVSGPYKTNNARANTYYRWSVSGRPQVHTVISLLWNYLTLPKIEQAKKVWEILESRKTKKSPKLPDLPTGE